jgi:hypothetical protein
MFVLVKRLEKGIMFILGSVVVVVFFNSLVTFDIYISCEIY